MNPATTQLPPPTPGEGDVWWEVIDACDAHFPDFHDDGAWKAWREARPPGDTSDRSESEPPGLRRDMRARRAFGIKKHGTTLQRGNGRPAWTEAYQECLDLTVYLWSARAPAWMRWLAVFFAWAIRRRLP